MFWLISLLLPSRNRQETPSQFDNLTGTFKSPVARANLLGILGVIAVAVVAWAVLLAVLSLINFWIIILLTMALGGYVLVRNYQNRRREMRIDLGFCANCGYDLRASPGICPECGRDARLDEPVWRKLRREHAAKKLAEAAPYHQAILDPAISLSPIPKMRTVLKTPDFHDGPIPLEGDETPASTHGAVKQPLE